MTEQVAVASPRLKARIALMKERKCSFRPYYFPCWFWKNLQHGGTEVKEDGLFPDVALGSAALIQQSSAYSVPPCLWFDASREGVKQCVSAFSDLLARRGGRAFRQT